MRNDLKTDIDNKRNITTNTGINKNRINQKSSDSDNLIEKRYPKEGNWDRPRIPDINHDKYTNSLIDESSPYLLMHAHNPVNWYPWGKEALDKAKKENKPIIVSIGYAACHWCHVMEKESFEDPEVAQLMNEHFVSIKVDREERPDIDQIYMDAVQIVSGRGGWPLNAFAMPDGKPFFAGTYFPKEMWMALLVHVADVYKNQPDKIKAQAEGLTEGVQISGMVELKADYSGFTLKNLRKIYDDWEGLIDFKSGGTIGAPKFPVPVAYRYLLKYHHMTGNPNTRRAVTTTLDNMAMGGIYDQVGGGFARYSTDPYWKVPHFEKMLYDNAQLVSLYSYAFQLTKNPLYKQVVYQTLDFIQREMTTPPLPRGGVGFYSSLDADSEGEEGKFYTWTEREIRDLLGDDAPLLIAYYNVTKEGNWEKGRNVLIRRQSDEAFAASENIDETKLQPWLSRMKNVLLTARNKRPRPPLDDKILTAWNAMMLTGYTDAYRIFGDQEFLKRALDSAAFLKAHMITETGALKRVYKESKTTASIDGFLDDYAFTIRAFIGLYTATFDPVWLEDAQMLLQHVLEYFFDKDTRMFYYTSGIDSDLIARKMEIVDNVIPSSNSVMAENLFLLGHYFAKDEYIHMSKQMVTNVKNHLLKNGPDFANWVSLMSWFIDEPFEVAIVGEDCLKIRRELDTRYFPDVILLGSQRNGQLPLLQGKFVEGQTTIYVCKDRTCRLPVSEVADAIKQLQWK